MIYYAWFIEYLNSDINVLLYIELLENNNNKKKLYFEKRQSLALNNLLVNSIEIC